MMNATLAFYIIDLIYYVVPPFVLIVLPRYVKEAVSSSGSPFNAIGLLFFVLAFIIVVLLLLMWSLSCLTVFNSTVFLHLLMAVGEESEVIRKVQVLQLAPGCPLDPISSVLFSLFQDPVYDRQNQEWSQKHE